MVLNLLPTHQMTQLSFIIDAPNLRPNHHHMGFISPMALKSQWYKIHFGFFWSLTFLGGQMNEVIDQLTLKRNLTGCRKPSYNCYPHPLENVLLSHSKLRKVWKWQKFKSWTKNHFKIFFFTFFLILYRVKNAKNWTFFYFLR